MVPGAMNTAVGAIR